MRTGSVLLDPQLISGPELRRTEYFNDFLWPMRAGHVAGVCLFRERSVVAMMSTFRPLGAPELGQEEVSLLRTVLPHVQGALAIHRRLSGLELEERAAWEALDRLPFGAAILDGRGKILFANRSLEALFRERDGLFLIGGTLAATLPGEQKTLGGLIAGACATGEGRGLRPGGAARISRPSCKRPFAVLISPLGVCNEDLGLSPAAVVFVTDPETRMETPVDLLQRLYGLTPAEANVAALLVCGASPAECSERLGVGMPTIRTHLRHVFEKTGTSRQSGLVRLLLSDAALLGGDSLVSRHEH